MEITTASLAGLESYYSGAHDLDWPHPFSLPGWMEAWWEVFGAGFSTLIIEFQENGQAIGFAPLKVRDGHASLIGDSSVCDYLDFITRQGHRQTFLQSLPRILMERGLNMLDLSTLRPDSVASRFAAQGTPSFPANCLVEDVSYEMPLPADWETYLASLEPKQLHELERKLRRIEKLGQPRFEVIADQDVTAKHQEEFFAMMTESRRDKAGFLDNEMRRFFTLAMGAMARYGLLRMGFLSLGRVRVAGVLFFLYNKRVYLYNSGYNPAYRDLSVGLISKFFCLRWAIENKLATFDFLKGPEPYKQQLGGHRVELTRCRIALKEGYG